MATALPDLIAEEHLNFIANFKDRETFLGKWENRFDATRTKCFEVQFGIQGRDGNFYPFTMSLFYLEALWNDKGPNSSKVFPHFVAYRKLFCCPPCGRRSCSQSPKIYL